MRKFLNLGLIRNALPSLSAAESHEFHEHIYVYAFQVWAKASVRICLHIYTDAFGIYIKHLYIDDKKHIDMDACI